MSTLPRISVVTSSYNQGPFIAETIDSVLAQEYPNLEHIVVDGMSTDQTPDVLARYPHLKVIREPDKGQADAINKGFRAATGDIFCFLNSDDTFLPGALHRVAREIDPARGRHVVMGRCRFIDEHSRYFGIEHPSHFQSFRRVLEVWKGHMIPQPAVFWTPEVWRQCGPLDLGLKYHLDYDLFCRFARRYRFHTIDQVFATYRLHAESKTVEWSDADRLEDSIRLSRRYWGPAILPLYWRLALSLAAYRFNRVGRAQRRYLHAEELQRHRHGLRALPHMLAAGLLAPDIAFYAGIYPWAKRVLRGALGGALQRLAAIRRIYPQTAVYMDRTLPWEDGWAGPRLIVQRDSIGGEQSLLLQGTVNARYMSGRLTLSVIVDGTPVGQAEVAGDGFFGRELPLPAPLRPGPHTIEIHASAWVVYHRFLRNGDYRPLSWMPAGAEGVVFRHGTVQPVASVTA